MNNSKKIIRNPQQEKKFKKARNPKIWIISSIVLVVILIGSVLFDQLYKRVILTIDGNKYNMEDLSYYFYGVETRYDYINQLYGGTYWDSAYNETSGLSNREVAKQEAISTAIYNEVLYKEAIANDYSLTDAEKETVNTDVASMLNDEATKALVKQNHFTKKFLTKFMGQAALVGRYHQDVIDSLDIDDESIKAGFKFEDYRQYDIEYLHISTQTTDEAGKQVAMSEDEKTAANDKINALYESALTTKDWSTLIPADETELKYQKNNFVESDSTFPDDFKAKLLDMENDAISEVFESNNEYYIVRMLNNSSTEAYDSTVKEAISAEEDTAFATVYQDILKKYSYKVNEKELDKFTMGQITLVD